MIEAFTYILAVVGRLLPPESLYGVVVISPMSTPPSPVPPHVNRNMIRTKTRSRPMAMRALPDSLESRTPPPRSIPVYGSLVSQKDTTTAHWPGQRPSRPTRPTRNA